MMHQFDHFLWLKKLSM